ncbi:MAG: hypothetical protein ABIK89_11075 [Planctomycetota bacterium]
MFVCTAQAGLAQAVAGPHVANLAMTSAKKMMLDPDTLTVK